MSEREAPVPSLATAILAPQDRIVREPLDAWAARLLQALDTGMATFRHPRKLAGQVGWVANNAALIAAHRGEMKTAWRITERQLWWHGRQARRSRDPAVTAYGVQAWVNLGRLEALSGRCREALARFAALATFDVADRLEMGCLSVVGEEWSAVTKSRGEFLDFLGIVHVSDSLKTMLLNRRFDLVAPFVNAAPRQGAPRWVCEEAAVIAGTRLGDPEAAAARAAAATRETRGWSRAVLRLREGEAHACAGDTERAAQLLAQVAGVVRLISPEQMANPRIMPINARLAAACHEVGLNDDAYALAQRVLNGARTVRDEPITIEMLRLLADVAPDEERDGWADAARAAAETTGYVRYRGGTPPPSPAAAALYERLEQVFSN